MSEWVDVNGTASKWPAKLAVPRFSRRRPTLEIAEQSDTDRPVPALQSLSGWAVVAAVSLYCLLAGLVFFDALSSMVTIWLRSQTFAHGFLILPISLWLVWRRRHRFRDLSVRPEPRALLLVLASGMAWLLAYLVDVQVIQHLAFVAVLVTGVWAILGTEVARSYAFPLGFLFLAVPMGAGLIPPLMGFTADTTEWLLRASGIPVFREGMYLSIPTGTWSVIEECSGVRYLIASFTLGLVYAHLSYHGLWRRLAFVAASIVVPILANSVRAYGVVMVGHLSEMRYGVGADHLIYGWVFFGLVMLLMFWVGSFWQQPASPSSPTHQTTPELRKKTSLSLTLGTALAMLCAITWPAVAAAMNRNAGLITPVALEIPAALDTWQAVDNDNWQWRPGQPGADRELDQHFVSTGSPESVTVGLHIRQYLQQHQGTELVTSTDPWRPDRTTWRVIWQQPAPINLGRPVSVDEARLDSARQSLLVWSWYRIDGRNTANSYLAKLLEAKQQLVVGRRQGTRIFVATSLGEDSTQARQVLQNFVTAYQAAIESALEDGIVNQDNSPNSPAEIVE